MMSVRALILDIAVGLAGGWFGADLFYGALDAKELRHETKQSAIHVSQAAAPVSASRRQWPPPTATSPKSRPRSSSAASPFNLDRKNPMQPQMIALQMALVAHAQTASPPSPKMTPLHYLAAEALILCSIAALSGCSAQPAKGSLWVPPTAAMKRSQPLPLLESPTSSSTTSK